ncbi:lysoplasmalogenase [Streptomyces sp. NPDC051940]|uniref:lysoplasmalogenase n=1 Tax=Streptomyces sp. NPDC051940 TaxID=3155675 RepID=UPI003426BA8F
MPRPRPLLRTFAAVAAVHLVAVLIGVGWLDNLTKPLLMPLLAAYAAARKAPRLLTVALLCGWGGDVLLQFGSTVQFLVGMGFFAAGHVCYLLLFRVRPALRAVLVYAAVWAALIAALWGGLDAGLRVPVAVYSLLLAAMACCATGVNRNTAVGGALFLLSDTLIATDLADWPQLPAASFWVMLTYLAAQYLLTDGVLQRQHTIRETEGPATGS